MNPIPLVNIGNTCYINSVLQCFMYQQQFIKFIELNKNKSEIIEVLLNIKDSNNLIKFIKLFVKEKPWFNPFQQNDSHEFLMYLMDVFENVNKESFKNIYNGLLKTTIICKNCKNKSVTYSDYNSINLNVSNGNTIYDLFEDYLKPEEQNDPTNLFFCDTCKTNHESIKKYCIYTLPDVLIIVFNRYAPNGRKINKNITFPVNDLEIKEKKSGINISYNLVSIINHYGIHIGGHYTSINKINNDWYFIDDNNITKLKDSLNNCENNVNSYILFYSKE